MAKKWEDLTEEERTPEQGYKEAIRRIDINLKGNHDVLDLSYLKLLKVPAQITSAKNLKSLRLHGNKIVDINLLKNLTKLTSIRLDKNNIIDISVLENLSDLKVIDLSENPIDKFEALSKLLNITHLHLIKCNIKHIDFLTSLENIKNLSLSDNNLSTISPLSKLKNLQVISIRKNKIEDLAPLSKLTELRRADFYDNNIKSIYPLKKIISTGIPIVSTDNFWREKIGINIFACPVVNPPQAIIQEGSNSILEYWRELDLQNITINPSPFPAKNFKFKLDALKKAYEGRLIIIGEGKVGKTTLLNKLKNPDYELEKLDQTHGINIWRDWKFPVPKTEVEYSASVWDFGGQDIQHLTHQYFFTPGTVFLLVVNKRGSNAADEARQLNYWFRIIELMGRYGGQKARVLVVHNVFTGDKSSQGINLGPYQEKCKDTLEITLKEVNLAENSGVFNDLRDEIQDALINLPGIGEDIIAGWPDIRRKIGERRGERRISFREFGNICAEHDITTEDSQLLLSRYLARLGELLHYEHGGLLFDNVLLDIDWITTAVYGITENQDIINRNGRFTREEIVEVWKNNGVTDRSDHELMLQLLQTDAFELCWQTDKKDYLTPTLFSTKMPENVKPVKTNLGLRFHYDYLPKGLLGQLIVRLHKHLEADHYWQDGIFLAREGCRARVSRPLIEKDGERIIEIIVEGEAPRNYALLSLVVQELETIHQRSFPRIRFRKEIPCPCERCHSAEWEQAYFSYEQLLQLRRAGDQTATCANQRPTDLGRLLEGMQQLEKQSPMSFANEIRSLVSSNRLRSALELLDRQYPTDATAALLREYNQLESNQIMGTVDGKEERLISAQISKRLLTLADVLARQSSEGEQRKTLEEQLPDIRSQLDRIEATGKDTNDKVTALGQILLHVGKEVENMRGDLFESRQEERRFMRKLEETVEQLPAAKQPGDEWYDQPAKAKIKVAIDLLALVPGMSLKWEKEMGTAGARVPRSWGEFKGWFIKSPPTYN